MAILAEISEWRNEKSAAPARKIPALVEEYLAAMRNAPFDGVRELINAGVPIESIALACPVPLRIAPSNNNEYTPDPDGRPAWIVPVSVVDPDFPDLIETDSPDEVIRSSNIVDLVAFSLLHRHFALRTGLGSVLGVVEPQYCAPETVAVHRSVLGWLRNNCRGIVLLTGDRVEAGRILRQICRLRSADGDDAHADELEALLRTLPRMHLHTMVERSGS